VAALGSQLEDSRSSVRQWLECAVVTQCDDSGEPGTFMTIAPSPDSVRKYLSWKPLQPMSWEAGIIWGLPREPMGSSRLHGLRSKLPPGAQEGLGTVVRERRRTMDDIDGIMIVGLLSRVIQDAWRVVSAFLGSDKTMFLFSYERLYYSNILPKNLKQP
jgi:hypothetical protein